MKIYQIRLHKALSDYIGEQKIELTNPEIARNITSFGVKVGDELLFNRQNWLLIDQKIDISHWPKREMSELDKTQIWLETPDFLLINKPFGVVCQSGNGHKLDNLEFWLNEKKAKKFETQDSEPSSQSKKILSLEKNCNNSNNLDKKLQKQEDINSILASKILDSNQENLPFLPVHRLDKNTQGLILFAKGLVNLEKLQNEFRERRVVKKYLAVVDGIMDQNWFISNWQARDKNNAIIQKLFWNERSAKNYDQNAKSAVSIIIPKLFCEQKNQTLIQVQILTGRMHQIRLQCQNIGFPLVSDAIYGDLKNLETGFFNPKLGDFLASFPFLNLNYLGNSQNNLNKSKNEEQSNSQNNSRKNLQDYESDYEQTFQSFDNWDNSSIQIKSGKLEKLTQNLNPREKHFFAQKEREKLNLKVRFIDKKSKNVPIKNSILNNNLKNNSQTQTSNILSFPNPSLDLDQVQLEGFYNFFGANTIKSTNLEEFINLKNQIFGANEYCLLANFLGIKINDFYLESQIFDLENCLEIL